MVARFRISPRSLLALGVCWLAAVMAAATSLADEANTRGKQATRLPSVVSAEEMDHQETDHIETPANAAIAPDPLITPAAYEEQLIMEDFATPRPKPIGPSPNATRLLESTWYARIDYFYWAEQVNSQPFMKNEGAMPTVGWQQRRGRQRYRAEVFGSSVDYFADMGGQDNSNVTDYLGLRGEYELMWEPETWEKFSFFTGVGSRFFVRSIPDVQLPSSLYVDGYQESWWTFYPYVGAERRRRMNDNWEAYWRARVGVTAYTREHIALDDVTLFPRANLTGQVELGFRGPRLFVSGFFEVMAWSRSPGVLDIVDPVVYLVRQPDSQNVMVGLKSGWSY
jgi:hypothetical protein